MIQPLFEIFWRGRDLRKLLFLGLVLVLPGVLSAQLQDGLISDPLVAELAERAEIISYDDRDVVKVSLEDILLLTISRSLSLEASRLSEDIANQELKSLRARYIDQITTRTGLERNTIMTNDPTQVPKDIYAVGSHSDSLQFSSTFARRLRTGSSYGFTLQERFYQSATLSRKEEIGSLDSGPSGEWRDVTSVRAFASIPFFQDAGEEINNLPERFAELGIDRSTAAIKQAELAQLAMVASTYWDMVAVLENIEVQKSSVELSEQLLQDNQARLQVGTLNRTDVLVAETQLSRDRQALFSARLDALRIEDQLRAVLNLGGLELGFYPSNRPELRDFFPDSEELRAQILENDPQLKLLKISMDSSKLEVQQEENKLQTNLDLDLSYTMTGYANTPLVGVGDFIDLGLHGFQAALTWTVPLGDQATPERIKQKKIQQEQILLNMDSRKAELDVSLQTILRDLELAEQEVSTAQAVVKLAEEQLQNEIERFKLGQGTSFQVSQFQQQESQAKAQDILARVRYEKAYLRLLTLTGQIYEEFNLNRTKS
ncbi:MAG: TolC family protein [Proteobacteria bacterium]|nr:MAG: TolC family protein [Pseudomonadota bacterium]